MQTQSSTHFCSVLHSTVENRDIFCSWNIACLNFLDVGNYIKAVCSVFLFSPVSYLKRHQARGSSVMETSFSKGISDLTFLWFKLHDLPSFTITNYGSSPSTLSYSPQLQLLPFAELTSSLPCASNSGHKTVTIWITSGTANSHF